MRFPTSCAKRRNRLGPRQAIVLGLLHGPAELVPVSSSGHLALVPELLGWDYQSLDPELRKGFEVALHGGTAAGLLLSCGRQLTRQLDRRRLMLCALAAAPPGLAGLLLKYRIERHLGTPPTIAAGLAAGGLLMLVADRAPEIRSYADANPQDALWLGLGQACALVPGVSRSGATLAVARLRGFARPDAARLSLQVGLPVIAGAAGLEAVELSQRRVGRSWKAILTAGTAAAFVSTVAATRAIRPQTGRGLSGWAAYRLGLAGLIVLKWRSGRRP